MQTLFNILSVGLFEGFKLLDFEPNVWSRDDTEFDEGIIALGFDHFALCVEDVGGKAGIARRCF